MPHAELKYSDDLTIDARSLLHAIERVIQRHDPASGECKGRAYPTSEYHHTHLLLTLSLLPKPHRDEGFTKALMQDVEATVKGQITQSCFFSFGLEYSGQYYVTHWNEVAS